MTCIWTPTFQTVWEWFMHVPSSMGSLLRMSKTFAWHHFELVKNIYFNYFSMNNTVYVLYIKTFEKSQHSKNAVTLVLYWYKNSITWNIVYARLTLSIKWLYLMFKIIKTSSITNWISINQFLLDSNWTSPSVGKMGSKAN